MRSAYIIVFLGVIAFLAAGTTVVEVPALYAQEGDCVECESDQTCGDPTYDEWDHCVIFKEDGEKWCNMEDECGEAEEEEEDLLLAVSGTGRFQTENVILGADGATVVSACSGYLVRGAPSSDVALNLRI